MTHATDGLDSVLQSAIAGRVTPGAALLAGSGDDVLLERYVGVSSYDTVYDLSSLTKPLATVASLGRLVAAGRVALDTRVVDVVPEFAGGQTDRSEVTLADLLAHRSGLPAHRRYFEALCAEDEGAGKALVGTTEGKQRIEAMAASEPLERSPRATAVYSDVGYILLGRVLERAAGRRLDSLVESEVIAPMALTSTGFMGLAGDPHDLASRAAPCGRCAWRGRVVCGCVQDENAFAMGGVAGHAGLFSTARDVHRLVAAHVCAYRGEPGVFSSEVVRSLWTRDRHTPGSTWALGWDTPSVVASSAGARIGHPAFGHLGFTGTSVWIDLERGVHVVFLTNRLDADADGTRMRALRPRIHDAVFDAVDRLLVETEDG